jgi:hypothetical protein
MCGWDPKSLERDHVSFVNTVIKERTKACKDVDSIRLDQKRMQLDALFNTVIKRYEIGSTDAV